MQTIEARSATPSTSARSAAAAAALTVPRRQPLPLLALLLPPLLLLARSLLRQGHGGRHREALRAHSRPSARRWRAQQLREGGAACTRQPGAHGAALACAGASKLKVLRERHRQPEDRPVAGTCSALR